MMKSMSGVDGNDFQSSDTWYTFVTADGAHWAFWPGDGTCAYNLPPSIANSCAFFEVDVNGTDGPNRIGYDIFGLSLTKEGVFPFGGAPGEDTSDCDISSTGWGCSAKVIMDGKIDW